ncbi:hypothetical protein PAPYR_6597 [Paratrimastix pyriformis]|uniref:Uncharacterized protein n=1 Tax=Paratrimastix pyriformis TaxID=342808 RepID=A0ABQ8UKG7_9EUKA|nr:hypothetical protein PAPYR_6597 [Paratrimastix pyriformis]
MEAGVQFPFFDQLPDDVLLSILNEVITPQERRAKLVVNLGAFVALSRTSSRIRQLTGLFRELVKDRKDALTDFSINSLFRVTPSISALCLDDTGITNSCIDFLTKKNPMLESLSLRRCKQLTSSAIYFIWRFAHLRHLDITDCGMYCRIMEDTDHLRRHSTFAALTSLNCFGNRLVGPYPPSLRHLEVNGLRAGELQGLVHIKSLSLRLGGDIPLLSDLAELEDLRLDATFAARPYAAHAGRMLLRVNPGLRVLHVTLPEAVAASRNPPWARLTALEELDLGTLVLPALRRLGLPLTPITAAMIPAVLAGCPRLVELDWHPQQNIMNSGLTPELLPGFLQTSDPRGLTTLKLDLCGSPPPVWISHLITHHMSPRTRASQFLTLPIILHPLLSRVWPMNGWQVSADAVELFLEPLRFAPHLRHLYLHCPPPFDRRVIPRPLDVSAEAVERLARDCPTLETLVTERLRLHASGLQAAFQASCWPRLQTLVTQSGTPEAPLDLAALPAARLSTLSLSRSVLQPGSLCAFLQAATAAGAVALRNLALDQCCSYPGELDTLVTDEALGRLAELTARGLQTLVLAECFGGPYAAAAAEAVATVDRLSKWHGGLRPTSTEALTEHGWCGLIARGLLLRCLWVHGCQCFGRQAVETLKAHRGPALRMVGFHNVGMPPKELVKLLSGTPLMIRNADPTIAERWAQAVQAEEEATDTSARLWQKQFRK